MNTVSLERLFGVGERIGYEYQFYCVSDIVLSPKMSYYEEAVLYWLINPEKFIWTSYNTEFP